MTEARRPTPQEIGEPLAATNDGRVVEDNFDILTTQFPTGFLLVDHGASPDDLTRADTRHLRDISMAHATRADTIRPLQQSQKLSRAALLAVFGENPGLRGFRETELGREVQINPHHVDVFNEDLLDESLGERTSDFVHTQDTISLVLESGEETAAVLKSMRRVLKRRGYSKGEIDAVLKVDHSFRVDKDALKVAIDGEEVALLEGAWKREVDEVVILPRSIVSNRELANIQEAIASKDTPDAF